MDKITVNKKRCIGCGLCTTIAEKTFKMGSDGKSEVIEESTDPVELVKEAASSCPVGAIKTGD